MADVDRAIHYVIGWEDEERTGVITTAQDGKRTRFGIDEHYHPDLGQSLFYTTMGSTAALAIATGIYETEYASALCIKDIADQNIANKLLSLGVNMGIHEAAKILQDALGVRSDGRIGPVTLCRLEGVRRPLDILDDMRTLAEYHYREIVANDPEKKEFLRGWLRRAAA